MKVKEVHRTANIAWSPVNHNTALLAAGTSAHQVDASFDTSASLDIFEFNPASEEPELPLRASIACDQRIYKLVWSPHSQIDQSSSEAGVLIAGVENGIVLYSADAVLQRDREKALLKQLTCHTGAVHAIDVSVLLPNLFASGASESEVFVWDLNALKEPIPVGPKSFPVDEVNSVSWNRKISYILASVYPNRCVLWDLRKHESIIKLGDQNSRTRYKSVDWNPEIATQLALASEDDHSPIVQIWDLRNAGSAVKTLEGHQRGILSVSWCPHDSDFLLSTGKDGCVYCWDVNEGGRGEIIYALPPSKQWAFEVAWCPRIPSVFVTASDKIGVHTVLGEEDGSHQSTASSLLADSFPGMDIVTPAAKGVASVQTVKKAPKWLRRQGALTFSFDGKIVKASSESGVNCLELDQVVLDGNVTAQAAVLEQRLAQGQCREFCDEKIADAKSHQDREEWKFIRALYEPDHAQAVLRLLGYGADVHIPDLLSLSSSESVVTNGEKSLLDKSSQDSLTQPLLKKGIGSSFRIPNGKDLKGTIAFALLSGNVERAVELCLEHGRETEGIMLSLIGNTAALPELYWKAHEKYFSAQGSELSGLVYALVKRDAQFLVEKARIDSWRETMAALLNYMSREEFQNYSQRLGERLETELNGLMTTNSVLCYLGSGNVDRAVEIWLRKEAKSTGDTAALLQSTIEKVFVADAAVSGGRPHAFGPRSSKLFHDYAQHLASQGEVGLALRFLLRDTSASLNAVKHHFYTALGPRAAARETGMRQSPLSTAQTSVLRRQGTGAATSSVRGNQFAAPAGASSGFGVPAAAAYNNFNPAALPVPAVNSFSATSGSAFGGDYAPPPPSTGSYGVPPPTNIYKPGAYMPQEPSRPPSRPAVPSYSGYNPSATAPLMTSQPSMYRPGNYMAAGPAAPPPSFPPQAPMNSGPHLPSYQHVKAVGGWNDPPPLNFANRRQSDSAPSATPIMRPLPQAQGDGPPAQSGMDGYGPPGGTGGYGGMGPLPGASHFQPGFTPSLSQPGFAPSLSTETPFIPSQPEPPVVKEKAPIPTEHVPISEGFAAMLSGARERANASSDGHSVRRLDDVTRKLELLNDALREGRLSGQTLMGLHQIVQCAQMGDIGQASAVQAHLSTAVSSAEIGSFMPAIKILLQMSLRF